MKTICAVAMLGTVALGAQGLDATGGISTAPAHAATAKHAAKRAAAA